MWDTTERLYTELYPPYTHVCTHTCSWAPGSLSHIFTSSFVFLFCFAYFFLIKNSVSGAVVSSKESRDKRLEQYLVLTQFNTNVRTTNDLLTSETFSSGSLGCSRKEGPRGEQPPYSLYSCRTVPGCTPSLTSVAVLKGWLRAVLGPPAFPTESRPLNTPQPCISHLFQWLCSRLSSILHF